MRAAKLNAVGWTAVFALSFGGLAQRADRDQPLDGRLGRDRGNRGNVVRGQVGFPGFVGDYIHGLDPTFDIGARIWPNYAIEGITSDPVRVQGPAHAAQAVHGQRQVQAGGNVRPRLPGLHRWRVHRGHHLPRRRAVRDPIDNKVTINASFDIPFWVTFGTFSSFHMPLLFGGGVEYLLEPNLALTFKRSWARTSGSVTSPTNFAFNALPGWRTSSDTSLVR